MVPAAMKSATEPPYVPREEMNHSYTITNPVGTKSQPTQTDTSEENDVEYKLKKTLQEHSHLKSKLDYEKDFDQEIRQMNFALKEELRFLEKDKSAQIEKKSAERSHQPSR